MEQGELNFRAAKALLEAGSHVAGHNVLSESSRELIEKSAEHCDKKFELLLTASRIFHPPMMAKATVLQSLHTYLLLYNLAYGELTPAQELRTFKVFRQMAANAEKTLRELALLLAKLVEEKPKAGSKPKEPERKPLSEEQRRRLDVLIEILKASPDSSKGDEKREPVDDGNPSRA